MSGTLEATRVPRQARFVSRGFARYVLVSGVALGADYLAYWMLATRSGLALPTAAAIGYLSGMVVSYTLMRGRVFPEGWMRSRPFVEATLFGVSGLVGLALTYGTVWAVVHVLGEHVVGAKACALVVSFFGTYAFRAKVVFRRT